MRNTFTLALLCLCASQALGQNIGELCDPQYAEADEGFDTPFCDFGYKQMRRQLNMFVESRKYLFHPRAVTLTPRDPENRNWFYEFIEPPEDSDWVLEIRPVINRH